MSRKGIIRNWRRLVEVFLLYSRWLNFPKMKKSDKNNTVSNVSSSGEYYSLKKFIPECDKDLIDYTITKMYKNGETNTTNLLVHLESNRQLNIEKKLYSSNITHADGNLLLYCFGRRGWRRSVILRNESYSQNGNNYVANTQYSRNHKHGKESWLLLSLPSQKYLAQYNSRLFW